MSESSKFHQKAAALRAQVEPHINCAQAVVVPFAEAAGVPDETAMRFAGGFGGGMRRASVCGAITGGIMALGLFGLDDPKILGEYHRILRERHDGMLECAELLRANAALGREKKPHCDAMVLECVDLVEEMLRKYGKLECGTAAQMTEKLKQVPDRSEVRLDAIRGCIFGGAVGDALGYPVEFLTEETIFQRYGAKGITAYEKDPATGKALISDDTQMSLFTANGLLVGETRGRMRGIQGAPRAYVEMAYQDWLKTQERTFEEVHRNGRLSPQGGISWLLDVPELFACRAPGNTCLSALREGERFEDYIKAARNQSKGCGGIMRVAPLAAKYHFLKITELDREGAQLAAITHGHSLGYMPAAVLVHILNRLIFPPEDRAMTLLEIIQEARDTVVQLFKGDAHLPELVRIIDRAIVLSQNGRPDLENIHALGEGWVAEETLGIALYCALRHQDDFSAGIIAAVNHNGDSDSTGAVTGNILGALLGYEAIADQWKADLELSDVILEIADDLANGCRMSEYGDYRDPVWTQKYIEMRRPKMEKRPGLHRHSPRLRPAGL